MRMDADKTFAEFSFKRLERFLDQHFAAAMMHDDVFVLGKQVVDFWNRHEHEIATHARAQMGAARCGCGRLQPCHGRCY